MTVKELINIYNETGSLTEDQYKSILEDYRVETIDALRSVPNHKFALALLNLVVDARLKRHDFGSGDNIMFASYLLGLHDKVEDSLRIWEAKISDFDSYCHVDIQLVVFAGVDKTLNYLRSIENDLGPSAIEYIKGCQKAGDFSDLDAYFTKNNMPWWL